MRDHVSFYDSAVPYSYYASRGWRGRVVLWLWRISLYLQRKCEYYTMLLILNDRRDYFPQEVRSAIISRFQQEDSTARKTGRGALRAFFRDSLVPPVEAADTPDASMERRYYEGRKGSDDPMTKSVESANRIFRMAATGIQSRYKLDQKQHILMELDAQAVPAASEERRS